jgi:hypothetical protein
MKLFQSLSDYSLQYAVFLPAPLLSDLLEVLSLQQLSIDSCCLITAQELPFHDSQHLFLIFSPLDLETRDGLWASVQSALETISGRLQRCTSFDELEIEDCCSHLLDSAEFLLEATPLKPATLSAPDSTSQEHPRP